MTFADIGVFIGINATIIGGVYWFLKNDFQNKFNLRQRDFSEQEKKFSEIGNENLHLREEMKDYQKFGIDILAVKQEIDNELSTIINQLKAHSGTVYIPYPQNEKPNGLKIISILPINKHTRKLYKQLTPLSSIAGNTYEKQEARYITNASIDKDLYKIADMISGYTTTSILSIPIKHENTVIAVLQLFKEVNNHFSESDLDLAKMSTKNLSNKVNKFIELPNWQNLFHVEQMYQNEIIMFCDLTSSTLLFRELNIESVFSHINLYFEEISNIALSHGAIIDKYMGDGVLFRFTNAKPIDVITSAKEMIKKFEEIKSNWKQESYVFDSLFLRIGLGYGPVIEKVTGHSQHQSISIFGQAVNIAVNLCDIAPRDKNVIILSSYLYRTIEKMNDKIQTTEIHDIGKAGYYDSTAYILK